ncbi:hypothetical protein [Kurthia sp. Dielmo]|uniref:hypothetical protein n=1 Tax=Kurthia sp. Dielmo TaxID=1033738 RepID=UPI00111EE9EF|nr:hypothetical protein [Kurthia sp. Dielmo]
MTEINVTVNEGQIYRRLDDDELIEVKQVEGKYAICKMFDSESTMKMPLHTFGLVDDSGIPVMQYIDYRS